MESNITISSSSFAIAFTSFQHGVEKYPKSPGPFVDFQSGLAAEWEGYKEWLYYEGRRLLDARSWKKAWIGTGKILDGTIRAIEIHHDKNYRNNTVEWDGRHGGESSKSHRRMIEAKKSTRQSAAAERALFAMYAQEGDPATCFVSLTEQFGHRYDLIAYLFFLRDWREFMPLRPTTFETAFERLGVPLAMSMKCSWENYSRFLERLREVRSQLERYGIPGGVRLIDAHSFCWMLAGLGGGKKKAPLVNIESFDPVASQVQPKPADREGDDDYDPEQRQQEQRRLGDLAQAVVLEAEKQRLTKAGKHDLAGKVEDVSRRYHLGYDIQSFHEDGSPKPIEVKAAGRLGKDLRFYLSENERAKSRELAGYTFALVLDVTASTPRILEFAGDRLSASALHPVSYEVWVEGPRKRSRE